MTFKNIKPGLVMMAIFSIWGMSVIMMFVISFVMPLFMSEDDYTLMQDYAETFSSFNEDTSQTEDMQRELNNLWDDFGGMFTAIFIVHWATVTLMIYWISGRIGRVAESTSQAVGYGVMIALGVMMSYGVFCTCMPALSIGSPTMLGFGTVFVFLFIGAGFLGGRGAKLSVAARAADAAYAGPSKASYSYGPLRDGPVSASSLSGVKPETYYNMGVQAALGGRREEARQHFTRVLQMQPRHVAAWLQMANLADTPEQAWNYVQQARSINPTDPAVLDAVNVIWPQVSASAAQRPLPTNQPPYVGGQQDDTVIPCVRLPGSPLNAAPAAGDAAGTDAGADDQQPPAPPPPPPASTL